jgi:hypothetical protein
MRRIAIQMDPPEGLKVATDSTVALAEEAIARGFSVAYYHPASLALDSIDGLTAELFAWELCLTTPRGGAPHRWGGRRWMGMT